MDLLFLFSIILYAYMYSILTNSFFHQSKQPYKSSYNSMNMYSILTSAMYVAHLTVSLGQYPIVPTNVLH